MRQCYRKLNTYKNVRRHGFGDLLAPMEVMAASFKRDAFEGRYKMLPLLKKLPRSEFHRILDFPPPPTCPPYPLNEAPT